MATTKANTSPISKGTYHMVDNAGFEPLRNNNFELQIVDIEGSDTITLSVANYAAPSISINPIEVHYANNSMKFAGKPSFAASSVTFNDFVGVNVERRLSDWQKLAYNYDTQEIGLASEYKKTCYLIEYLPNYTLARQWELHGCWISDLNLGDFNQDGNAVRQVSGTITYDWAQPIGTGEFDESGIATIKNNGTKR